MSDDFEQNLLTGDGKWWEFLDPQTYEVRMDLPQATRVDSGQLDWSRARRPRKAGPMSFAFFNHCSVCGQGVPPDFTFCVHCGGEPRSADRLRTYTVVIAGFETDTAREAAAELVASAGYDLGEEEVSRLFDDLPAVINVEARRDQVTALTAKLSEVGIAARGFPVDDPSIPWVRETFESIVRQPRKLFAALAVMVLGAVLTYWSAIAFFVALVALVALVVSEFRWYRNRYCVSVASLLELLTGFDGGTANVARETLRLMGDREARSHVTVCLMEYYTLTRQFRAHSTTYGAVLAHTHDALEELMADVLRLAHQYAKLDDFVNANSAARLQQRLDELGDASDAVASKMVKAEIAHLTEQIELVSSLEETRTAFRERLAALARSMELMRTRFAAVRARPSAEAFREMQLDEALRELDEEFEVFEQTFAVVQ